MTVGTGQPPVSVITTLYNAESFLSATLRSLLAQTFTDYEAIIVDDGSTDGSADLARRLTVDDPRFRVIQQPNQGYPRAVNRGLAESRGTFVAFLDHDDLWRADKLERQLQCFERNPNVGFVGCYSALLDPNLRCTGWRFGSPEYGSVYSTMVFCDLVAGGSVPLVRRQALEQAGLFDPAPEVLGRSDWDQWLRLSRHAEFAMVEEVLVGYTRRASNFSADYRRMIDAGEAVLAKASTADPSLDAATLRRARARDAFGIFCLCLADGQFDDAAHILRHSLSIAWAPVLLAPRRWGVLSLFLLARAIPERIYTRIWRSVARTMFGITPGTPFVQGFELRRD